MSGAQHTVLSPAEPGAATPVIGGGAAHSPHDWHSAEYVRAWIADYDERIASRQAQFDLLADLLPFAEAAPARILDLGAGWGPVTLHLVQRFPAAQVTLLDYSAPMLAQARERLTAAGVAERVAFVQGDLSQPGAVAAALNAAAGPFDAVVSSLCVHNLRPSERIAALYQEVGQVVAPGGAFLNIDHMGMATSAVADAWRRVRVNQLRRERRAQTGTLPSFEEVEAALRVQREARQGGQRVDGHGSQQAANHQPAATLERMTRPRDAGQSRTLLDHLGWLRDAGFEGVDCFWRQERLALIGGFKS
jgi:ubiquinone/menaquinone biosynthesis C-methylase UbiE